MVKVVSLESFFGLLGKKLVLLAKNAKPQYANEFKMRFLKNGLIRIKTLYFMATSQVRQ